MLLSIQVEKLLKMKLGKLVNYLVTSEEVGAEKPNKKIFSIALKKLTVSKGMYNDRRQSYKKILMEQKNGNY